MTSIMGKVAPSCFIVYNTYPFYILHAITLP